jgi:ERCC4-related helicase
VSANQDARPLLPHQQALVDQFFAEPTVRGHVVRADVGLGSSFATAHIIKRFLETQPDARILVLSPKVLQAQTQHVLADIGVRAEAVDRYRFREMQDAAANDEMIWQAGKAFILGTDFAKREDIARSLCAVPWTLLVVPEAHQLAGLRENVVQKLVASSPDARLLFLTLSGAGDIPTFGIQPWTEIKWRRADVVDAQGQPIFRQPPTKIETFGFQLDAQEQRLRSELMGLVRLLGATGAMPAPLASVFVTSMSSSPAALEEVLQRLRSRVIHRDAEVFSSGEEIDDETDTDDLPSAIHGDREELVKTLNSCLALLDALGTDSKMAILWELVSEAQALGEMPRAMCILTEYRATLFYLQEALEGLGLDPYILHGAMSFDERAHAISRFKEQGGVLIATTAMTTGLDLPQVETAVLYDLPRSPMALEQIYGRFQRFGRNAPLVVQLLIESDHANTAVDTILGKLRALANQTEPT